MRKLSIFMITLVLIFGFASMAGAVTIFNEDFNTGGVVYGVPVTPAADNNWYGARFEDPESSNFSNDIRISFFEGDTNRFAVLEDDCGILIDVPTLGYNNVTLTFDWLTNYVNSSDRFVAGYYVGDITGFSSERTKDLRSGYGSPNWGSWTELLRDNDSYGWNSESFNLPSNQAHVWIAFWLDNGDDDNGLVDNIRVSGTASVPEPATMLLLGMGLLGMGFIGRRRFKK